MKVVLVGYGHLGKWHAEKLASLYGDNFTAIVELDKTKHSIISEKYPNLKIAENLNEVIDLVDAVAIATPTTFHYDVILETLKHNKHCFVEKPMTSNLEQSINLGKFLKDKEVVFQVGHSERFHGFWPRLIELENFSSAEIARIERVAPYKGRGDDVDIIYDLMIHDYDMLSMLGFGYPLNIQAWGSSCHTKMIDYCTSKLTYSDKIVFVTASRSNVAEKRYAEFVFEDGILEIDLLRGEVRRSKNGFKDEVLQFDKRDHLFEEHKLFKNSIESGKNNEVNYEAGHLAMKMMDLTVKSIKEKKAISWE